MSFHEEIVFVLVFHKIDIDANVVIHMLMQISDWQQTNLSSLPYTVNIWHNNFWSLSFDVCMIVWSVKCRSLWSAFRLGLRVIYWCHWHPPIHTPNHQILTNIFFSSPKGIPLFQSKVNGMTFLHNIRILAPSVYCPILWDFLRTKFEMVNCMYFRIRMDWH